MSDQNFSARRCKETRKPLADKCPDVSFFQCSKCDGLYFNTNQISTKKAKIYCCDEEVEKLIPKDLSSFEMNLELSYIITGGYNDNSVEVKWNPYGEIVSPKWIFLKTFKGGYLKYVDKRPPLVFALADTDAFAYCDEQVCLECVFRCKRGFVLYIYIEELGLISIPLDKMNAHWQSEKQ